MAEARHRARLTHGIPPRAGIRIARAGAVAALVTLVALGYRDLRLMGLRFRWETERSAATAPGVAGRAARRVATSPATTPTAESAEAATRVTSLEPPGLGEDDLPPPGTGRRVEIDFESFGDGSALCAPCAVSREWAADGLILGFRSWTASSDAPYLLDGRDYLPPDASRYAIGPAFRSDRGLEVGVVRLDFTERPRSVAFSLYGPDIVPRFEVTAWSGDRILIDAVTRERVRTYDIQGRGLFREERVTVRADAGIDRVSLDGWGPPGHMLLVDDLVITP
ncbi:MAG: hypothetical protein R3195_08830 [Gemmatimonadota bacterium]|nr:hypothetical protein [Gemmatimonadota bacterium]